MRNEHGDDEVAVRGGLGIAVAKRAEHGSVIGWEFVCDCRPAMELVLAGWDVVEERSQGVVSAWWDVVEEKRCRRERF
ncbi:hypothetical protein M0R45_021560 [Rubus argutus]|uniref:Uncharacterized protein n=1 Tax=Rubus argutus TaxID=59490 RepID=A0AAW1XD00_RUBAR